MNQQTVLDYHERTKHHFNKYANGPVNLNWDAQPDSFRCYTGAKRFKLPLVADNLDSTYVDLYQPEEHQAQPLTLKHVAALLELSLGLSAWKQYGNNRWALRCNPSSGNLHPTEGYLLLPQLDGIPAGVYHYLSRDHVLEQGCEVEINEADSFLLGLTSIPWREAWKYGERAFRYCQHDIGHAIAAVRYAAATLGWKVQLLDHWSEAEIITKLGLDQNEPAEREIAEVMLRIQVANFSKNYNSEPVELNKVLWLGTPNVLDQNHYGDWDIIDTMFDATVKPVTEAEHWIAPDLPALPPIPCRQSAATLIRQRRSAQMFDGATSLNLEYFYRLLDTTLARNAVPWDVFPYQPQLHLVLFVHRVKGLSPGMYILLRREGIEKTLRNAFKPDFKWTKPDDCPEHLLFYQLLEGNAQKLSQQISCHQDIAGDSAFSLGMLAEFETGLKAGAWAYRRLFWEAGLIGQVLYLEAEAVGVRGTGIGCYFDDEVHRLLGLTDTRYQSLYHFTVGTPLQDERLQTLPPYAHLE